MIENVIGVGSILLWAAIGNIVWVVIARQKFEPACWLAWPLMLVATWGMDE